MEEIKKSGLTFQQAVSLVDNSIQDVKNGFVATGYYLWVIHEERLWEDDGYNSFQEFLHCQYQKDKSWASRCISLYEQFGKVIEFGELPVLADSYREYSVSQLIEMISMTEAQREQITPEMKIREIRDLKPKREKKTKTVFKTENCQRDPNEELEEQLPGQMELAEYIEKNCDVATSEECNEEYSSSVSLSETVEEEVVVEEPLSAYGTPRKVYRENSLITTAGCESKPGGFKGGHNCFSCAKECEIRQKFRYCVEAPMGNPFPCNQINVIRMLRDTMGDKCQFVNQALAYHSQGNNEPTPCCKDCDNSCDYRCERSQRLICMQTDLELEEGDEDDELDGASKPKEVKTYDREILEKMIAEAEEMLEALKGFWIEDLPHQYTKKVMEIQAYKDLLAKQEAVETEVSHSDLVDNLYLEQADLPVMKNNDQRKEWLKNYKSWGLWYYDEHIDVNYYKFDFKDGSRLVVAEFPQRENSWSNEKYDQHYYHLIEHGRLKYRSDKMYEDKYQYHCTSETELIGYLKKIQQKRKETE